MLSHKEIELDLQTSNPLTPDFKGSLCEIQEDDRENEADLENVENDFGENDDAAPINVIHSN